MRTEFGMSAREGWAETPTWELDALFAARAAEINRRDQEAR